MTQNITSESALVKAYQLPIKNRNINEHLTCRPTSTRSYKNGWTVPRCGALWSSNPQASTTCSRCSCLRLKPDSELWKVPFRCTRRWLQSCSHHRYQVILWRDGEGGGSTWSGLYHSCGLRPHSPISNGVSPAREGPSHQRVSSKAHVLCPWNRLRETNPQKSEERHSRPPEL